MAITTTEIKVGTVELDKVDRVIEFFQTHGFMVKEYQGYETWVKPCIPVLSDLIGTYFCIQIHMVGETWIIKEWVTNRYGGQMDAQGIMAIVLSLGTSLLNHNNVMSYLNSL